MAQNRLIYMAAVRELAERFDGGTLESCMNQALADSPNRCFDNGDREQTMNILAKAGFVRTQMQQGASLAEAMRELGRRIRKVQ